MNRLLWLVSLQKSLREGTALIFQTPELPYKVHFI